MAGNSTSPETAAMLGEHGSAVEIAVLALTSFSVVATSVFLVTRLCCTYVIPVAWRASLVLLDVAHLLLGAGLVFFLAYLGTKEKALCSASGFFLLAGLLDLACMLCLASIALLFLQNPGKLGQLSTFRQQWLLLFLVPEKVAVFLLSLMPVLPIPYFDTDSPYPLACFPIRQEGGKGAAFGAILFFILWVLEIVGLILSVLSSVRLWKSNNSRIHASSPNLWQTEKIGQGRALQRMLMLEQVVFMAVTFTLTLVNYTNSPGDVTPQWVVMAAVAVATLLHVGMCGVQLVMWSSACCCHGNQRRKEPYQKLKKLELIKVEGPGKMRLKASWSAGRGVTRRGLVKVYGLRQLQGWAQEIVVLGMLRKSHHASLLQCLWTANTNPYFETMTMLSGQIVTAESRLICLELTSSGSLQDFLSSLDVPLPEPCTRTILHDLAEGLTQLHTQNILHGNLTSAAVYLKGSVQRLVLRAALGDFEEAQVYGSLQSGAPSSVSKKHFFLPDVRAFALVALEILGVVCERRQDEKQPHRFVAAKRGAQPRPAGDLREGLAVGHGGGGGDGVARHEAKNARASAGGGGGSSGAHFCAPGAADEFSGGDKRGGGIFVVGSMSEGDEVEDEVRTKTKRGVGGGRGNHHPHQQHPDHIIPPPSPFNHDYADIDDYDDRDSGLTSLTGYYPDAPDPEDGTAHEHNHDEEDDSPRLPPITHVKEAYRYEFPPQSVFKAAAEEGSNDYEEIEDIEEQIHREIRYNALHRRRDNAQGGGYIVTRTTSGRELFLPHNASFGNSDSGYVGTSSNSSSRYPYSSEGGHFGGMMEEPPDMTSWPKAAHRTVSANTISSFGDDVLEVLPGMTEEDEIRQGDQSLRQMLRARDEAKVEQILQDYNSRVVRGDFSRPAHWPKLKFSRTMAQREKAGLGAGAGVGVGVGEEGGRRSRPSTPRGGGTPEMSQQETSSPRPKTAGPGGPVVKRLDKARPLSASTSAAGAWKLRNSFRKSRARNELSRALSRAQSVKQGAKEARGAGGKAIEHKYAKHNAAFRQDEEEEEDVNHGHGKTPPMPEPVISRVQDSGTATSEKANPEVAHSHAPKDQPREHSHPHDQQHTPTPYYHKPQDIHSPRNDHHLHQTSTPTNGDANGHGVGQFPSSFGNSDNGAVVTQGGGGTPRGQQGGGDMSVTSGDLMSRPQPPLPPLGQGHTQDQGQVHGQGHDQGCAQDTAQGNIHGQGHDQGYTQNKSQGQVHSHGEGNQEKRGVGHSGGGSQGGSTADNSNSNSRRIIVVPGMKPVDSGFDEDSASVISDASYDDDADADADIEEEAEEGEEGEGTGVGKGEGEGEEGGDGEVSPGCTCRCGSETVSGGSAGGTCSCQCSQCRSSSGHSPQHSHSHSHSCSESDVGTWSNSNSFSSYDVQMHRRKLPSKSQVETEHVLGPDEQYPEHLPSSNPPPPPSSTTKPFATSSPNSLSPPGQQRHQRRHHHHNGGVNNHHHHHHHRRQHSFTGSSTSSRGSSSAAARRYRELTQKGVPLRVSRVDEGDSPRQHRRGGSNSSSQRLTPHQPGGAGGRAEVIEEEEGDGGADGVLYRDLESQGFFSSTDSASSKSRSPVRTSAASKQRQAYRRLEVVQGRGKGGVPYTHYPDLPTIPSLEDLIQEIPDETGSCSADETKAFLNRPESELSVKVLKRPAPPPPAHLAPYRPSTSDHHHLPFNTHHHHPHHRSHKDDGGLIAIADLHREPQVVHDAELVIDRMFSRAHPANARGSETFVDPSLGLDEDAIRQLAMMPPAAKKEYHRQHHHGGDRGPHDLDGYDLGEGEGYGGRGQGQGQGHTAGLTLLRGTDGKHVRYAERLAEKTGVLSAVELLPADQRAFDKLQRRLVSTGSFGAIGIQLLDIVGACWVRESPPTAADIVHQLTDHVTETEL